MDISELLELIPQEIKVYVMPYWQETNKTFEEVIYKHRKKPSYWLSLLDTLESFKEIEKAQSIYNYLLKETNIKKALIAEQYAKFCSKHYDLKSTKTAFIEAIKLSKRKNLPAQYAKFLLTKKRI